MTRRSVFFLPQFNISPSPSRALCYWSRSHAIASSHGRTVEPSKPELPFPSSHTHLHTITPLYIPLCCALFCRNEPVPTCLQDPSLPRVDACCFASKVFSSQPFCLYLFSLLTSYLADLPKSATTFARLVAEKSNGAIKLPSWHLETCLPGGGSEPKITPRRRRRRCSAFRLC